MIDPLAEFQNTPSDNMRAAIQGTDLVFIGIVEKVIDRRSVIVKKSTRLSSQEHLFGCDYFPISTSLLKLDILPMKGDIVLVVSLQHLVESMLSSTESILVEHYNGYSYATCVAIPLGSAEQDSKTSITVDEDAVVVDAPEADLSFTAKSFSVQGKEKHAVYWEDLQDGLNGFLSALKTSLTTTPIAGNGNVQPTWTAFPSQIDISGAKSDDVTVG